MPDVIRLRSRTQSSRERTSSTMRHRLHPETDQHHHTPTWRNRVVAALATLSLASGLVFASTASHAQDGTGGAPPLEETDCVLVPASDIDDLLDGSDLAETPAEATPVTDGIDATPIGPPASPVATPVAESALAFDAELLQEDLTATVTSLMSCLDEGNATQIVNRTSATFRGQLIGSPTALSGGVFTSLYDTLPQVDYSAIEITNVQLVDESIATAEVVWQLANQVRVDTWTFSLGRVQGLSMWTIERAEPGSVTPSIEAQSVDVTISGNRYELSEDTVDGDSVLFNATNEDPTDHELLVLQLDDDVSTGTLLTTPGPQLPSGVTLIGQATIGADSEGYLLLSGLERGTYTIVCLLPDENGLPHLADGMEASFEVE